MEDSPGVRDNAGSGQDQPMESPAFFFIGNKEKIVTSSAKVAIKFPITNDSNDDEDDFKEKVQNNTEENKPSASPPVVQNSDFVNKTGIVEKDDLLFQGVVRDSHSVLAGAAVKLFACYRGGIEKPLAYTFTDNEGVYLINIPFPEDYGQLEGFIVRAGKSSLTDREEAGHSAGQSNPRQRPSDTGLYNPLGRILNNRPKTLFDLIKASY